MTKEIQQLTPGVVKKLRSGIAFMSVSHCVEELVLNSIDAEANCIAVNLNLPLYQIQVIDNGCGISAEQMNIIGTRYATSKCHTLEDLQNLKSGGFRGEALSSLAEITSVLMIESRTASFEDTYCKIFTQGKALEPKKSLNSRPSKGTTVTVYDFMYNLPVRKKSISEALDVEECRKLLQSIALMYPNISFTLQNEATGEMCLQLRKCSSVYHSFLQMYGKSKASNLKTIDYQLDNYEISGCISTECYISKDLQFLYVNKRRVLRTKLHKLVNRILNKVLSSKQKSNSNSSSSISENSSPLKNQCYCIFVINFSCPYDKYDIIFEPRKTMIEFSDWDSVLKVVEEALIDFLKRENLYSSVNETELNASNSKTQGNVVLPSFDVQDIQHGLFSHVARRLKLLKSDDLLEKVMRSQNSEKIDSGVEFVAKDVSKLHNSSKSMSSDESKSPGSRKNILSSDQEISMNPSNAKSIASLVDNLSRRADKNTPKETFTFAASQALETDLDIPCRSVFPSQNPVMLRIPSKSTLSNLQTNSNNSKFLQMQEKIQSFVRQESSNSFNKHKQTNNKVPLVKIPSNRSMQNSPLLCIDEKKLETKLKNMINKASQCPSVSSVSKNDRFFAKETKDKSLQCPSVTDKNKIRVQSRFEFKEESNTLLRNLAKSKRMQKNPLRKPHDEISTFSNNDFAYLLDDNDNYKSKKFKSAHFAENFEVNSSSRVVEKRKTEDFDISIGTGNSSSSYKNSYPADYFPYDIELFPDSHRKIQIPNLYQKKSIDFDKFKSSFGLQTFNKVRKSKHPGDNAPLFKELGKSFCFQKEEMSHIPGKKYDHYTPEHEVNSYQDLFPDIITDNVVHTPEKNHKKCYLTDSNLSSNFKQNTGPFLTEKVPLEYEELDENNAVDDIYLNLNDVSPSSSVVSQVVNYLVSNAVKINNLPCSPNSFVYNKSNGINEVHRNIPEHLRFEDEVITYSNMSNNNKAVGLCSNDNNDALSNFRMKSMSNNNLMSDVASNPPPIHFTKSTVTPSESSNPLFSDNIVASTVDSINFESDPYTQKLPTISETPVRSLKITKSSKDTNSETSSFSKKGSGDNFLSDCFTEQLLGKPGNDIKTLCTSLANSQANKSLSNLEMISDEHIELQSDPFSEKLSAASENNSAQFPCTKLSNSDTNSGISASQMRSDIDLESDPFSEKLETAPENHSVQFSSTKLSSSDANSEISASQMRSDIDLECDPFTEKLPSVPKSNSAVLSEIKLSEAISNENHEISPAVEIKSTAEIEFESNVLNEKLSTISRKPVLEEKYSDENDLNKNIPNSSSEELFKESSSFELDNNSKVSNKEQHISETSVISSSIKNKGSTDSHKTGNSEVITKTSTENDFTTYDHLKLHSQPECKRKIYIDSITGNSSYIVPEKSEMQQNEMTVIDNGFKKSHFFLTHDYSLFVSKTQTPDKFKIYDCNVQCDLMDYVKNNEKYGHCDKWRKSQEELNCNENIENMLIAWDNPAFDIPYEVSSIGDDKITQSVSQMHFFLNSYRFSKTTLNSMQVIGQVDCKFIACILKDFNENFRDQNLLALFDQHAVHERIRLEQLIEDLYELNTDDEKYVKTAIINPPLEISLSDEEIRLLQVYCEKLHKIGIHLKIDDSSHVLRVFSVPLCLIHKETGELRRSVSDTVAILQNAISEWLSSIVKTRSIPQVLPKTLSSILNYQACRSAVKFGDPLSFEQCCHLMKSLSSCKLPFQCAHGRPSVAPILDLKKIEALYKKKPPPQLQMLQRSTTNS